MVEKVKKLPKPTLKKFAQLVLQNAEPLNGGAWKFVFTDAMKEEVLKLLEPKPPKVSPCDIP